LDLEATIMDVMWAVVICLLRSRLRLPGRAILVRAATA
jgi:hypothetical protein